MISLEHTVHSIHNLLVQEFTYSYVGLLPDL